MSSHWDKVGEGVVVIWPIHLTVHPDPVYYTENTVYFTVFLDGKRCDLCSLILFDRTTAVVDIALVRIQGRFFAFDQYGEGDVFFPVELTP